jgi:hypothetical protein
MTAGPVVPLPHRELTPGVMPKPDELSQLEDMSAATNTADRMTMRETRCAFMIVRLKTETSAAQAARRQGRL